ncbi:aldo/keto reductase [Rubrobacter aplysinae]|uniref:aldo/keto reductase n=1 Tax=Rubrobacter aplysinae TaxID=909625 RepID=UPI00064B831A|nr:aldo/keto reductase [Rubrobacter aplysinae]
MDFVESNEALIPALGFGTYRLGDGEAESMVGEALSVGYRHVDTAQMYRNEAGVGRSIKASSVDRDEVFLTTKVWPENFRRDDLLSSMRQSLSKLDVDHVDLVLLHWPSRGVPLEETISALNESRERGDTRHIGVSNFGPDLLSEAAELSDAPLINDQVEYHPFKDQSPVLETARRMGISVTAYSPLDKGRVSGDRTLREIGRAHGKDEGQVALRWLIQQESVIAIPKTASPERCRSNFEVFDFELSGEEMSSINALAR